MEKIKLSEWAKDHGKTYRQAWNLVANDKFPEPIERTKKGQIMVIRESSKSTVAVIEKQDKKQVTFVEPASADLVEDFFLNKKRSTAARRNKAATTQRTDPYYFIENGVDPYRGDSRGNKSGNDAISVRDTIILTQKAYYNFSDFRNIIDVMTEFSTNNIYFRGGTQKSRDFCTKFFRNMNLLGLQDKVFREFYRSGTVPIYKYEGLISGEYINNLNKVYGSDLSKALKTVTLPIKYVILNPANIIVAGNISFSSPEFYQRLTPYEIQRLKSPRTEEDQQFFDTLDQNIKKLIKTGIVDQNIDILLDPKYTYLLFNKKQDYEPMPIPMGWPVLSDLNWKAEMKAIDMAVARTTQRVVLLVKTGYESKDGDYMVDPKVIQAIKDLFASESVGKILIGDWTTEAEFVIPDIADILDPKKYDQVNEDIRAGLNNILIGTNEKFANQSIKVKIFIQRLQQSREVFLNDFLKPEIKKICKDMGFRKFPEPYFENLDLKDEDIFNRLITRLTEIGVLTPEECFVAMETGRLPTGEESLESQQAYKKARDKGLYTPLIGGGKNDANQNMTGRPAGTKSPQTTKKIVPSKAEDSYSLNKIKDNMVLASHLFTKVKDKARKKYDVDELNPEQEEVLDLICEQIIINEMPEQWTKATTINKYLNNPSFKNEEKYNEVIDISNEHQISNLVAGILHVSKKE